MRLDRLIGTDGSDNNGELSVFPAGFNIYSAAVWPVQCVFASVLLHCSVLHDFCMCQQCWRTGQLVFVTPTLASTFSLIVWHLLGSLSSHFMDNYFNAISDLFQRDNCHSIFPGKFNFVRYYCNSNDTRIRIANSFIRKMDNHQKTNKDIWSPTKTRIPVVNYTNVLAWNPPTIMDSGNEI